MTDAAARARCDRGATLLDVVFALTIGTTLTALSVPVVASVVDDMRASMAARYVAARIGAARLDAVRRSDAVALRFEPVGDDYRFGAFADGNGNGVRSTDIRAGVDPALAPPERLEDTFAGVCFGLMPGIPDADGQTGTGEDGVRVGSSSLLSMSSDGSSTSGTLYIRSRRQQYAVRILGVTGRTRMLQYQPENRVWLAR
ncbi:MAG TPA: hypothetical protein VFJ02_22445 [Vicinamibacterales bacterium]|nr:hypothetical protein [Vicinamibacterales bacterium]